MGVGLEVTYGPFDLLLNGMPTTQQRQAQATRELCQGYPLVNDDEAISVVRLAETDAYVLSVRDARAPRYVVDIMMRPLTPQELTTRKAVGQSVDPRGAVGSLSDLRTIADDHVTWELYNVEIILLKPRRG